MNPIITEQLNKFKTGDFSGYESFYNETVNTVYTMLHTIVEDQNVATSLVPQVYDMIYQNAMSLEQTERFYQWTAGLANEEALGYLKENGLTEIRHGSAENKTPQMITAGGQEETEQFYDYAVEDAALTITEEVVTDTSFVTKLQEIVNTLSPMERIAFQDYYYFGISVPEIAAKTGCKDTDIRYTLSQTRTSILQTIAETPAYAEGYGNPNGRKYHLAQAPWMWIAYQNFLGYTLGIDTISIAGWAMGVLGQAVGSGIAISAEGMIAGSASGAGAVTGASIAGGTAGEISAGATIGAATAGGAGAAGTSGIAAGFFGTIGGKIAIGIVGAAMATAIGVGVHHVVTENQTTTEVYENEKTSEILGNSYSTTEQEIMYEMEDSDYKFYEYKLREIKGEDNINEVYAYSDINKNGIVDLLVGRYDEEAKKVIVTDLYEVNASYINKRLTEYTFANLGKYYLCKDGRFLVVNEGFDDDENKKFNVVGRYRYSNFNLLFEGSYADFGGQYIYYASKMQYKSLNLTGLPTIYHMLAVEHEETTKERMDDFCAEYSYQKLEWKSIHEEYDISMYLDKDGKM